MFSGAKVHKNGTNQSGFSGTASKITWSTTKYDTDSWFDDANDRLTVPVGVTKVLVQAAMVQTTDPSNSQLSIYKNGSQVAVTGGDMTFGTQTIAAVFDVVATDYFEMWLNSDAGTLNGSIELTHFSITALDGPLAQGLRVTAKTASYTFAATDFLGSIHRLNHATVAINATVPANATVALPVGATISLKQVGAAVCTVVAAGGVTINPPRGGTLVLGGVGATASLVKVATDEWDLIGDTVAA